MSTAAALRLTAALAAVLDGDARALLDAAAGAARRGAPSQLVTLFARLGRGVGRGPLGDPVELAGPVDHVSTAGWTRDVAARVSVLLAAAEGAPATLPDVVDSVYRSGDSREKAAVLRALPLLPDGARFVPLALDAGRTNETPLFEALATDNPFPARHYPELELDKLVMKAAFLGIGLDRIAGLERRMNAELARMALDHVAEREAAGRPFTPTIWLVVAPDPGRRAEEKLAEYAAHHDEAQRLGVARALPGAPPDRARALIRTRLAVEASPTVLAALEAARQSAG